MNLSNIRRLVSKEKIEEILGLLIILLIFILAGRVMFSQKKEHKKITTVLTSVNSQQVTTFRIYPRVIRPVGEPIQFKNSDPLVYKFFQSLQDLQPYSPSHDRVISWEHSWFLEVSAGGSMMQFPFYIPSHTHDIVVGETVKFGEYGSFHYGHFQSELLFQWYQTYKGLWLEEPDGKEESEEGGEGKKSRS